MNKVIEFLLKYPKRTVVFLLILSIAAAFPLKNLRIGEMRTGWLGKDDDILTTFRNFQSTFHTGEEVVIAYPLPNGITEDELIWQKQFSLKLKEIPGVFRVTSLAMLYKNAPDSIPVDSLLKKYPEVSNLLLSKDHSHAAVVVGVGRKSDYRIPESDTVYQLLKSIKELCDTAESELNRPFYKSGQIVVSDYIAEGIGLDIAILFPLTIVLAVIILFGTFRKWSYTIIPVLAAALAVLLTLSLKALFNSPLTPLSTTLFVLVSVLGVSDSLHLFSQLHQALINGEKVYDAVRTALRHAGKACFYTSLTTSIGFLSLSLSTMPIIRELGIFAAAGIIIAFVTTIISLPITAALIPTIPSKHVLPLKKTTDNIASFVLRNYKVIFGTGVVLVLISLPAVMKTNIDSSLSAYLKKGSNARSDLEMINDNFGGVASTEVLLSIQNGSFDNREFVDSMVNALEDLREHEKVKTMLSYVTGITMTSSEQTFYNKPLMVRQIYHHKFRNYMNDAFDSTRITLFTGSMESDEQARFFEYVQQELKKYFPHASVKITGITHITHATTGKIIETQFKSLITASLVIMLIMWFLFGKRRGLIAMLVNLFPIMVSFVLLGYFGFPLNVATATIAAVAIGIVVDDTIHFNFSLNRYLDRGEDIRSAIVSAYSEVGEAMILSSIIIIAGVLLFLFAQTGLMVQFGILAAAAITAALIADLFWGPALLLILYGRKKVTSTNA